MTKEFEPRIYVACLAAYNNGYLHGSWIDATQDLETMQGQVNAMLKASPITGAEEYAIHDYEHLDGAHIGEFTSLHEVKEYARFLMDHQSLGALVLNAVFGDLAEAYEMMTHYDSTHKSVEAFAEVCVAQWHDIPDSLAHYIDYQAIARDLQLGGDIDVIEEAFDVVHIFWRH